MATGTKSRLRHAAKVIGELLLRDDELQHVGVSGSVIFVCLSPKSLAALVIRCKIPDTKRRTHLKAASEEIEIYFRGVYFCATLDRTPAPGGVLPAPALPAPSLTNPTRRKP